MAKRRIGLPIIGMTCAGCAATVKRKLTKKVPGVISDEMNFGTETATVAFDPAATNPRAMAEAVRKAGYELVLPTEGVDDLDVEHTARKREVKMRIKIYIVSMVMAAAFTFSVVAFAGGQGGGSGHGGGMMGGQGGGMMEGQGGGMTGSGKWMSKLWELLSNRTGKSDPGKDRERAALKTEIREKRRELVSLVQAENPDKVLINRKIEELDRLESELDAMMAASEDIQ